MVWAEGRQTKLHSVTLFTVSLSLSLSLWKCVHSIVHYINFNLKYLHYALLTCCYFCRQCSFSFYFVTLSLYICIFVNFKKITLCVHFWRGINYWKGREKFFVCHRIAQICFLYSTKKCTEKMFFLLWLQMNLCIGWRYACAHIAEHTEKKYWSVIINWSFY